MRPLLLAAALAAAALLAVPGPGGARAPAAADCHSGYVDGVVGGVHKCLHAGEFCSPAHESDYARYGFTCVDGHLRTGASHPAKPAKPGATPARTVLLRPRTRTAGCRVRGPLPDPRCSPGAIFADATPAIICASGYSSRVRHVDDATKAAIFAEYGIAGAHHGGVYEVDHIVPLELGGSNVPANLYPEAAAGPTGFHAKDRLENRVHDLMCAGRLPLRPTQRAIAANWVALYREVFG